MHFFKRMFHCGYEGSNDKGHPSVPLLCMQKKGRPLQDILVPSKNNQKSSKDISSENSYTLPPLSKLRMKALPSLNILTCSDHRKILKAECDLGFLVGVIAVGQSLNGLMNQKCFPTRIGKAHEINDLNSLRPYCFDSVVVQWSQLGCQFSLLELLCLQQHLVFVFQQWDSLVAFLKSVQNELARLYEPLPLTSCVNRLLCNLTRRQSFFLLQFLNEENVRTVFHSDFEDLVGHKISQSTYQLLMERLTLEEYVMGKKDRKKYKEIISSHLSAIETDTEIQKALDLVKKNRVSLKKSEKSRQCEVISQMKVSSVDLKSQELKFFAKRLEQNSPSPQFDINMEVDLNIFNYNFEEFECPLEGFSRRMQNLASPSKGSRKVRTRSVNITPSQSCNIDDEMFDKYQ